MRLYLVMVHSGACIKMIRYTKKCKRLGIVRLRNISSRRCAPLVRYGRLSTLPRSRSRKDYHGETIRLDDRSPPLNLPLSRCRPASRPLWAAKSTARVGGSVVLSTSAELLI